MDVNVRGALSYTAQAAGRQMTKYNLPGSIVLIASMSGSVTNVVRFPVCWQVTLHPIVLEASKLSIISNISNTLINFNRIKVTGTLFLGAKLQLC